MLHVLKSLAQDVNHHEIALWIFLHLKLNNHTLIHLKNYIKQCPAVKIVQFI